MKYTTIQKRYSEKWLKKITNVKVYTLNNCFRGEPCDVEALRWSIERLGDNLQLNALKTAGRLRCHSNCWYEFEVQQ